MKKLVRNVVSLLCISAAVMGSFSLQAFAAEKKELETIEAENVKTASVSGSIIAKNEEDTFTIKASQDGVYRFELASLSDPAAALEFGVYDSKQKELRYLTIFEVEDGLNVELEKGETYTFVVAQALYTCDYEIEIYAAKECLDLEGVGTVKDSLEFTEQVLTYSLEVPEDGEYQFIISGLKANESVEMDLQDEDGRSLQSRFLVKDDEGLTYSAEEGEKLYLYITQSDGLREFELTIHYPDTASIEL